MDELEKDFPALYGELQNLTQEEMPTVRKNIINIFPYAVGFYVSFLFPSVLIYFLTDVGWLIFLFHGFYSVVMISLMLLMGSRFYIDQNGLMRKNMFVGLMDIIVAESINDVIEIRFYTPFVFAYFITRAL